MLKLNLAMDVIGEESGADLGSREYCTYLGPGKDCSTVGPEEDFTDPGPREGCSDLGLIAPDGVTLRGDSDTQSKVVSFGFEYKALEQCSPKLVERLKQSPSDITTQLIPSGVLAPRDVMFLGNSQINEIDKAEKIVRVVVSQVKADPKVYHTFIKALKAAGSWTKSVVTELEQTYTALSGTFQKDDTHSKNAQLQKPLTTGQSNTRNFYQVVEEKPSVDGGVIANEESLNIKTVQLRMKFTRLVMIIIKSIEKNEVTVKRIFTFLQDIKAVFRTSGNSSLLFTHEHLHRIEIECNDLDEVFRKLNGYYSWFNFGLIEVLVNTFCYNVAEVCTELSDYEAHFKRYCKNRLCQIPDPQNGFGEYRDFTKPYVFKIDKNWSDMKLSDMETILETIRNILNLNKAALCLRSVRNGCVELTFDLPKHVIVPISRVQFKELEKHGIKFIAGIVINVYSMTTSLILQQCDIILSTLLPTDLFNEKESEYEECEMESIAGVELLEISPGSMTLVPKLDTQSFEIVGGGSVAEGAGALVKLDEDTASKEYFPPFILGATREGPEEVQLDSQKIMAPVPKLSTLCLKFVGGGSVAEGAGALVNLDEDTASKEHFSPIEATGESTTEPKLEEMVYSFAQQSKASVTVEYHGSVHTTLEDIVILKEKLIDTKESEARLIKQLEQLSKENQQLSKENQQLSKENQQLSKDSQELMHELYHKQESDGQFIEEILRLRNEKQQLKDELYHEKAEHSCTKEQLEGEIETLKSQLHEKEKEVYEARIQLAKAEQQKE